MTAQAQALKSNPIIMGKLVAIYHAADGPCNRFTRQHSLNNIGQYPDGWFARAGLYMVKHRREYPDLYRQWALLMSAVEMAPDGNSSSISTALNGPELGLNQA